jgi:AAA domain, putative AbiEii toxin, Type IV TA system
LLKKARAGRLKRLRLENVRCFEAVDIPLDERVTVIVGENGSGKSTIIEALASLTYGAEREGFVEFPLRRGAGRGRIAFDDGGRRPAAVWESGGRREALAQERYVFAYGRYRRVASGGEERTVLRDPAVLLDEMAHRAGEGRAVTLNRPDNNLREDISKYLVALNFGRNSDPRLERVWTWLTEGLPRLDPRLGAVEFEGSAAVVTRNGVPLKLKELSDGYQALLVIVFDLALRYPYIFQSLENPMRGDAVVGIDEVDLHLHPRWQRTVLSQLIDFFPNTQFVVTTHSPIVVQGAIDAGMTVVSLRESEGGVKARTLGSTVVGRLRGAEVGSLLIERKLFHVESRYSSRFSDLEQRADKLQEVVSSGATSDEDYQELKAALDEMEELVAKEDERRADTSTVAQITKMKSAFVKDLIDELQKARRP